MAHVGQELALGDVGGFGSLPGQTHLGHVGVRAEPANHLTIGVLERQCASEEPAELPITASQRELHFKRLTGADGSLPSLQHVRKLVGIVDALPAPTFHLLGSRARILVPPAVVPSDVAVAVGPPREVGNRLGQRAELPFPLLELFLRAFVVSDIVEEDGDFPCRRPERQTPRTNG